MTLAHVAGVPFEEWLFPLVVAGGSVGLALRASINRMHRRT
jgi:hypothetical protein